MINVNSSVVTMQSCVRLLLGIVNVDDLSDDLLALSTVKGRQRHCRISSQVFISLPLIGHGTSASMLQSNLPKWILLKWITR